MRPKSMRSRLLIVSAILNGRIPSSIDRFMIHDVFICLGTGLSSGAHAHAAPQGAPRHPHLSASASSSSSLSASSASLPSHVSACITGLDTCIRKPMIVTCGIDKSVRIWNVMDKTSESLKCFKEEALAIAMHPSGFHLVVAFSDKLRMLNILMDDIRPYREFPVKQCHEVRFSHGRDIYLSILSIYPISLSITLSITLSLYLSFYRYQYLSITLSLYHS